MHDFHSLKTMTFHLVADIRDVSRSGRIPHVQSGLYSAQKVAVRFFSRTTKEKFKFSKSGLTRSYSAIFANPDSNRINGSCMCTVTKEENSDKKSLIERPDRHT